MSSWNQPVCDVCWRAREPERLPCRLVDPDRELCAICGAETRSGIFVRMDPAVANYPRAERADD